MTARVIDFLGKGNILLVLAAWPPCRPHYLIFSKHEQNMSQTVGSITRIEFIAQDEI